MLPILFKVHRLINSEWGQARRPNPSTEEEDHDKEEENCTRKLHVLYRCFPERSE
jgi:hypothetical protein